MINPNKSIHILVIFTFLFNNFFLLSLLGFLYILLIFPRDSYT